MSEEIIAKIIEYLATHFSLNLGTVTTEGKPFVHTIGYASDGVSVYFVTNINSRKGQNMLRNNAVAYTIDQDKYENWGKINGIQASGIASVINDKEEIEKAKIILFKKFPQMANLPPMPGSTFFKVEPTEIYFLDYTKSFGHRDKVVF